METKAVLSLVTEVEEWVSRHGTIGRVCVVDGERGPIRIVLVQVESSGDATAAVLRELTERLDPACALFVGLATGVRDVAVGTVVAASKVYAFDSGAYGDVFKPYPDLGTGSYRLLQRADAEALRARWIRRLHVGGACESQPLARVGPIAAGNSIVETAGSAMGVFLQQHYTDALAVETAGRGFLQAAHQTKLDAIVVRGVSRLLSQDPTPQQTLVWDEQAASNAAAFAIEVLVHVPVDDGVDADVKLPRPGDAAQQLPVKLPSFRNALSSTGGWRTRLARPAMLAFLLLIVPLLLLTALPSIPETSAPTTTSSRLSSSSQDEPSTPTPPGMLWIEGGAFLMGTTAEELRQLPPHPADAPPYDASRETPARQVTVSGFLLDANEVTNERFAAWLRTAGGLEERVVQTSQVRGLFVMQGETPLLELGSATPGIVRQGASWTAVSSAARWPVALVTWFGAQRYCEDQGASLPTEAQWELAARGRQRRTYAWGESPAECATIVFGRSKGRPCSREPPGPVPIDALLADRTPGGVIGLGGNVREWVLDAWEPHYRDCPAPCKDPSVGAAGKDAERVVRGCGFGDWSGAMCRAARRSHDRPDWAEPAIGFRCAISKAGAPSGGGR